MELRFNKEEKDFLIKCLNKYNPDLKQVKLLVKRIERSMKSIKPSSAKGKGRDFQYWVCQRIAEMYGVPFIQSDDNCLIHSREMGLNNVDVILRDWLYKNFTFDIECKAQENLSIPDWIEQAKSNKKLDRDWLLVVKKQSIGEPFVVMSWDCFERIWKDTNRFQSLWYKTER